MLGRPKLSRRREVEEQAIHKRSSALICGLYKGYAHNRKSCNKVKKARMSNVSYYFF